MKVQIVDPPAYTPPYDRALCAALARAGADVELVTSRFVYGPVAEPEGYRVSELFHRRAVAGDRQPRARRVLRAAEHPADMLRLRRHARDADVVHLQWPGVPAVDRLLLPRRPRVMTLHDPLPAAGAALAAWRSLLRSMDAVISHSESGVERLVGLGIDRERVHRIPHGAFDHLPRIADRRPLPPDLAEVEGPVVLCFGLIRPYKGIEVLLRAFAELEGAELWIVGMPRMPLEPLEELARRSRSRVRFVPRFVTDPEIPAFFERADLVVLPYLEIEQSGVLYTALAFGSAIVASAVGGFVEVGARDHALRLVEPGDADSLRAALAELLADPRARAELAAAAARAAAGPYSWDRIAAETLAVYRPLVAG